MRLTVLLFAKLRESAGSSSLELELAEDATVGDLRAELAGRFPAASELFSRSAVAVNNDYVIDAATLHAGDLVAIIPPVSGG